MSILGDDDEGRQYINIFEQGELSIESRPFEDENPIQLAQQPNEPDDREPEEITDTPEEPSVPPTIGEVEEFVSMEEPEDLSVSLENIHILTELHQRIARTGVISRNDVLSVESIYPGTIPNGHRLNAFSIMPAAANATVSMEGLGAKILDKLKALLDYILERLSRLTGFVLRKKEKLSTGIDVEWETFLKNVSKVQGRDGLQQLRNRDKNDPIAKKASSLDHYFRMYADATYLRLDNRWKSGYNSIQLSTDLPREMLALSRTLNTTLAKSRECVSKVRAKDYNINQLTPYTNNLDMERDRIRSLFGKREFMRVKLFSTAIKYPRSEIDEVNKTFDTMETTINDLSTQIKSLRSSITERDGAAAMDAVKVLNSQIADINRQYSLLDIYVTYYIQYVAELSSVINVCNTRLTSLGGLKR